MSTISEQNAKFWNEACGTHLASRTGTLGKYKEFDERYFEQYPFLTSYLDKFKGYVLEVGTGYGTVAQYLHDSSIVQYAGLDIAQGPLDILKARGIRWYHGDVLDLSFSDNTFDGVVSIGCLHHTGDLQKGIDELHRVLKVGGDALIMLYNEAAERPAVDNNTKGQPAPHIEYISEGDVSKLFNEWREVTFKIENGAQKDIYIEAIK